MRLPARIILGTLSSTLLLFNVAGYEHVAEASGAVDRADLTITAAGSSFAAPIFNKWRETYRPSNAAVGLSYDSVGSGEGIKRFLAGTVDIGATDAPVATDDIQVEGGPVVQIPVTAGMIAIAYNLPDISGPLNLPRDVYADIFLGNISRWDDPRIEAANPGIGLPTKLIQVVARSDSSGTTFAFTNHLAAISPTWADGPGVGKLIDWPGGAMVARGNEGVAQRIKLTLGSIGYVEAGFASRLGLPLAWLENRAGGFVAPTAETGQRALAGGSDAIPDDLSVVITDPEGARSYPIVTYTWALLRSEYRDSETAVAIDALLRWMLTDGQADADPLGYVPLPDNVTRAALAQMQRDGL
ncbi:MAG: phosphate ABC transporter substrate-binding protein PstS [Thiohalocapsa sp.]|nr:phosphate ABC transporter substrate-binding protein PstS [Thiohalocapsa sp.]MCF7991238.1 phosphate ABC transporter substrate-binding protein PstS [Thiohalocapsa sp.]